MSGVASVGPHTENNFAWFVSQDAAAHPVVLLPARLPTHW